MRHLWESVGMTPFAVCRWCGLVRLHSRSYDDLTPGATSTPRKTAGPCPPDGYQNMLGREEAS